MSARRKSPRPDSFTQSGAIRILGMHFLGKHGANPGERTKDQPIDVDVSVRCDVGQAARTDKLTETIDYAGIFSTCEQIVTQQSFNLLETLAEAIVAALWRRYPVRAITVRVRKSGKLSGATPEIQIRRRRLPR
jgi:dihydroneopterin aldolase